MKRQHLVALGKAGGGTLTLLVLTMLAGKVLAVVAGPVGIGLLSVLRQIRQTCYSLSTLSGQTALVQGASSRRRHRRVQYQAAVLLVFLLATLVVVLGLFAAAPVLAEWAVGSRDRDSIALIRWMALPVLFGSMQFFTAGALMAHRAMGRLAASQVASGIVLLAVSYPVAQKVASGENAALILLLTLAPFAGLIASGALGWSTAQVRSTIRYLCGGRVDPSSLRYFFAIATRMVVTAFAGTGAVLVIRMLVVSRLGLEAAGHLDAAWTIAITSPVALLASFQGFYLPVLSGARDRAVAARTIADFFALATVLGTGAVVIGIVLKPILVSILFSGEFLAALPALRWLLIGLFLRVSAWVLTVPTLADAAMGMWVRYELASNALLVAISGVTTTSMGIEGIGIAYVLSAAFGVAFAAWYVGRGYSVPGSGSLLRLWIGGFSVVMAATVLTWAEIGLKPLPVLSSLFLLVIYWGWARQHIPRVELRRRR